MKHPLRRLVLFQIAAQVHRRYAGGLVACDDIGGHVAEVHRVKSIGRTVLIVREIVAGEGSKLNRNRQYQESRHGLANPSSATQQRLGFNLLPSPATISRT